MKKDKKRPHIIFENLEVNSFFKSFAKNLSIRISEFPDLSQ